MKPWDHAQLMGFVPYEMPDIFGGTAHKVGVGFMPRDENGKVVPPLAEMFVPYGAVHPQGRNLLFAAVLMYQGHSRIVGLMRAMLDEMENLTNAGHVPKETLAPLVTAYEAIERESLTALTVATNGIEAVGAGMKGDLKR